MLIMYGIVTQTSIAKLFLAGYIPGILQAVFYIITIRIICYLNPEKGPRGPKFSLVDRFKAIGASFEVWLLFGLVLVGLTVGWFTPTEGGAMGAFGALVIPLARRRLNWSKIVEALKSTIKMTGMIYAMLIGAKLMTNFFAATNIPTELANLIGRMNVPPVAIMGMIILLYIILGTAMDENAMLWTTVPILAPIVMQQGYDLVWFGIICCRMITIGGISPPLGLSAMVVSGMAKVPQGKVFKNLWPFLGSDALHVLLLLLFPIIAMFLPNLAK
jgi:tripartite ATP-independent transporter DctM subunit